MSAAAVLAEAVACGLTLTVEGQKIIYTGPREAVTDGLLDRLRQHKGELLKLLAAPDTRQVLSTCYGKGYQHPDGRVETGTPEPMPRPTEPWPAGLSPLLNRVSTFYEWSPADRYDFIAWARRSPEGLADARQFLQNESAKLPAPGLSDRRRVVLDMLADDPAVHCTWTCADDGADPVTLTLAIRGKGTVELAIPRAKFDALGLPHLIRGLTKEGAP